MKPTVTLNEVQEKRGSYLEQFLKSLDIKTSSKFTYERQIKEFFVWSQHHNITAPTRDDLLAYKEHLYQERMLSPLTIAGYLTAVRRFFEWLESIKVYPNVAKGIKSPKRKRGFKKDVLTIDQVKELLRSINRSTLSGKRDFALINLMIRTGLRTIEVARICKEDMVRQSGQQVLLIHGKGRDEKDEIVVLTGNTLEPIQEYVKARGKVRDREPLFASHSTKNFGEMLTTRSVSRIVKNALRAINIDDDRITAHSLRHTAITFSLLGGATPQEARLLARHADINTTLIYAHNINRIKEAPEHKIDDLLE